METSKPQAFARETQSKSDRKSRKNPFLPKYPCCILRGGQAGNLHRITVIDRSGLPPEASGWYFGGSQSITYCEI